MGNVTLLGSAAAIVAQHSHTAQQHLTWRPPVPYLFGILAAMLGLIAFTLLLACSYWKLSGYVEQENSGGSGGHTESGEGQGENGDAAKATWTPPKQRIVEIMAWNEKPSFLAIPVSCRASYFGDCSGREKVGVAEKEMDDWTKKMAGNRDAAESEAVQVSH
ncbi:unnamed protein product [Spirodela intermedia]|uniref:Uncharacterized protein n=2 Tax=Spirodela intermedia TaxID=51605 RepID=A0A7I8JJG6_SPIIN|nr:unnamed protein product [Spirodela intermedia]CAA6670294.1 unnamed protein product [Spirodela intermedia]CAA7407348.1 unnamed protein product [Spirodela intermedia]